MCTLIVLVCGRIQLYTCNFSLSLHAHIADAHTNIHAHIVLTYHLFVHIFDYTMCTPLFSQCAHTHTTMHVHYKSLPTHAASVILYIVDVQIHIRGCFLQWLAYIHTSWFEIWFCNSQHRVTSCVRWTYIPSHQLLHFLVTTVTCVHAWATVCIRHRTYCLKGSVLDQPDSCVLTHMCANSCVLTHMCASLQIFPPFRKQPLCIPFYHSVIMHKA